MVGLMLSKSFINFLKSEPQLTINRVLEAGKEGTINTYMIIPSGVYGASTGPVKALGTIQYLLHEKAKELGFVPYVGEGSTIFNTVSPLKLSRILISSI
jgi:hypothetical protein